MVHRGGYTGDHWCPPSSPPIPCSPCTSPYPPYWTIGRVKFGVSLEQVCKNDIPGPLLVLILKLNKEGPNKKDVFRAPGHQASIKKLIHFLQNGRLVNIDNFSVYTIASVLKKFLRKLPDGIFGRNGELELFQIIEMTDMEQQRDHIHRLITSMPIRTQHLLVLLFGTFRVIAMSANRAQTGMTSEALGVSVAPSFFQSCVADGKTACMEDVLRFKVATQIMKFLIDNFGVSNLFGRSNYEYYARITGRILKVEEDWIFAFSYPPDSLVAPISGQEESQSTPALIHLPESSSGGLSGTGIGSCGSGGLLSDRGAEAMMAVVPENNLRESCTRLSISLEENGLYKGNNRGSADGSSYSMLQMTLDELRQVNSYAESTKSLSFLPQVHERQTERMRTRSEWFLSPSPQPSPLTPVDLECQPQAVYILRSESINRPPSGPGSHESVSGGCGPVRRSSSKDKERKLVRRSSSKKDKENGQKGGSRGRSASAEVKPPPDYRRGTPDPPGHPITDLDCTETDLQRAHTCHVYKPRI